MRLFYKRPLGLVLCIMLGGFVLFTCGSFVFRAFIALCIALLLLLYIISVVKNRKNLLLLACSVGLCFSVLFSQLYFGLWFNAAERFDGEVNVEATVCEIQKSSSYYKKYVIKTDNINAENHSSYKLVLYVDASDEYELAVGDGIKFKCSIKDFSDEYAHYSYAKGLSGSCDDVKELTVTENGRFVPEAMFSHLRELISRHAKMLSDQEAGSMLSALLFGERDMLSEKVQLSFKRLGITHLLSLSGLHLAILSFALEKIFRLLGVNKNIRIISTIAFTLLYMALTGFPVSVMRAGFMLILSNLLALCFRESDSVTSLFVAVALICLISPYAIYDISLWLSAFATLGIIVFSELSAEVKEKNKDRPKILSAIGTSLMVSAFAIAATMFITQFSFNGISLISPISTLIFSIFVELIMYIGGAMLIFGWILPLGLLLSPIVKAMTLLSSFLSSFDIFASKEYFFVDILVTVLTALFFIFVILDIKNKKRFALIITCLLAVIYASCGIMNSVGKFDDKVVYYTENKQDMFLIKSNQEASLISDAQYSSTTGYNAADILMKENVYMLDKYIATHYSWKLAEELEIVLSTVPVKELYLPKAQNKDEEAIMNKLMASLKDFTTEIKYLDPTGTISTGSYKIRFIHTVPYGTDTSQSILMLYGNDRKIAYISSGILNGNERLKAYEAMNQATDIVFGCHGKSYKNKAYFTAEIKNLENIVFSSNNLTIPSYTANYYIKNGCEIHSHPKEFVLDD